MPPRPTRARGAVLALPLVLPLATALPGPPAHAEEGAPVITRVTTANESGGLTPYVPLYTVVRVEFADPTPSAPDDYRVKVPGAKTTAFVTAAEEGGLVASFPVYDLAWGQSYDIAVQELDASGTPVASSDPVAWTPRVVKHPRKLRSNAVKVGTTWTYAAGKRLKLRFKGGDVVSGTRVTTQVWVSKRKKFTADDWSANVDGKAALVGRASKELVSSVKVPRRLAGRYLRVSVLLWKDGKAGWRYTAPPAQVIRR